MQPSKMQTLKSLFSPTDRRTQSKRRQAPQPVAVLRHAGSFAHADDELTPTTRVGAGLRRDEPTGAAFYLQRGLARSQPELPSARLLSQNKSLPEPEGQPPKLAPRLQSLTAQQEEAPSRHVPQWRNPSTDRLPLPYAVPAPKGREELLMGAESQDEVANLPNVFGHRRGKSSQDTSTSQGIHPDYSSSVASGFLSRGTSTNSTARSDATLDVRRHSLDAWSVQQDFFLGGLGLTPGQRSQLLVSLPESLISQYCATFDHLWLAPPARQVWPVPFASGQSASLEEERLMAGSRMDLDGDSQLKILRASQTILKTAAGDQRLMRCMRWLLHSDVEDGAAWGADELFDAPALVAPEISTLLEPLHLTGSQQARLNKHCRFLPHRLPGSRGWPSPATYTYRAPNT